MATKTPKPEAPATTTPEAADAIPAQTPAPSPASASNDMLAVAFMEFLKQNAASSAQQAEVLKALQANTPRREMDYAEYLQLHPMREFAKRIFQNGREVQERGLSDAIFNKAQQLRPGTYLNGRVDVTEINGRTHLNYKNKSMADRFEMERHLVGTFPDGFSNMIDKIYAEMKAREAADKK